MEILTFEELQNQIQAYYHNGEYAEALELATREFERFPEQAHLLYYWRIAMAARLGYTDLSIALFREVLEAGFWYGDVLLRKSPALSALQGIAEFERLVDLNQQLRSTDETRTFPLIILRSQGQCQAGGPPCPAMVSLHANASMAQASLDFWRPAASAGWLVAVPQSSQAMWKDAYVWDDRQAAEAEIQKHFADLTEKYAADAQRVVIGGHSMGGEMAIWLALRGSIPNRGFVAFGPTGPFMAEPESWEKLVLEQPGPSLRGYFIVGEEDTSVSLEAIQTLVDILNEAGILCELELVPHAGHEFAPEFESSLLRALEFILGE